MQERLHFTFDDPEGNLLIKSSNNLLVRVERKRLRKCSRLFARRLGANDNVGTIDVQKKGEDIGLLLRYCLLILPHNHTEILSLEVLKRSVFE